MANPTDDDRALARSYMSWPDMADRLAHTFAVIREEGQQASAVALAAEVERRRAAEALAADARRQAIEEVAAQYHDALADFFEAEWRREPLMGFAEEHFKKAKRHRSYSKEIREQVWIKADALLPPAPEEPERDR